MKNYLTITPPLIPNKLARWLIPVDVHSPAILKRAVYGIALCFRREFKYDYLQYGYNGWESDPNHHAFLWVDTHRGEYFPKSPCVGATCFRWREYPDGHKGWGMQWLWFHPYYRRTGLLSRTWDMFHEQFGDFELEKPLSDAMKQFLAKTHK